MGVRGWLTEVENNGNIVWRVYTTGPDKEVLIGQDFKPHHDWTKGQDIGVKTWPPEAWKIGGGTFWGWLQYDPSLNLIYYGTANAGLWNPSQARRQFVDNGDLRPRSGYRHGQVGRSAQSARSVGL
jgi:lanthanide-dependent methanol dehydrogenase